MKSRRRRRGNLRLRHLLPCLAALWSGCSAPPADQDRNIILIVTDTLRADYLSIQGGPVPTPNLDELARRGVRFERAYSHIPVTGPSHSSIFTGLLPQEHGVEINTQRLPSAHVTMAETLRDHGYQTRAVVSLGVLRPRFGFDQGFDDFDDGFSNDYFRRGDEVTDAALTWLSSQPGQPFFLWLHYSDPHEPYSPPTMVHPKVEIWQENRYLQTVAVDGTRHFIDLELQPGETTLQLTRPRGDFRVGPQLVFRQIQTRSENVTMRPDDGWLTTSATSQNGRPRLQGTSQLPATLVLRNPLEKVVKTRLIFFSHEDYSEQRLRELYAGETAYLDQQIGRLLRQLDEQDRWRDTIVVFTSDHGEGLGDHGRSGHIDQLYDSLLRVPLLIIAEGLIPSNEVVDLPVRLIDLLPTVLDLAGIPTPAGVHGTSLVPLMTDPTGGGPLPVIGSTYRPLAEFDQRSLIQFPYKYIVNLQTMDEELYDLRADPKEQSNLATSRPDLTTRMRLALEQSVAGLSSDAQDEAVTPELSQEEIDQLEALGYVN